MVSRSVGNSMVFSQQRIIRDCAAPIPPALGDEISPANSVSQSPTVISADPQLAHMATGNTGGREYSLVELFAIKFVLADVLIIALLLLAGPVYAIAATALIVIGGLLLWHLTGRTDGAESPNAGPDHAIGDAETTASENDPVTTLQERYAAGDLSEAEFEAKLDRLIESNERADTAGLETDDLSLERRG
jgi:hypothetical protein